MAPARISFTFFLARWIPFRFSSETARPARLFYAIGALQSSRSRCPGSVDFLWEHHDDTTVASAVGPFRACAVRLVRRGRRAGAGIRQGPLHQVRVPHPHARRQEALHRRLRPKDELKTLSDPADAHAVQRRPLRRRSATRPTSARRRCSARPATSSPIRTCAAAGCRRANSSTCGRTTPRRRGPTTSTKARDT